MCLAIPAQVRAKTGVNLAIVDVMGVQRTISLDLVRDAEVGGWVLMHAGFAIEVIHERYAHEVLALLESLPFYDADTNLAGMSPETYEGTVESNTILMEV